MGPAAAIYGSGSMFVQEEPEHLRRRKLLTPPLHGAALNGYVPIIEDSTRAAMRSWPVDRPFALLPAARALMLDVIVKVVFGVQDPDEVRRLGRPFERLLNLGVSEQLTVRYALRRLGTLRVWPSRARAFREIDDVVLPLIARRRNDPGLTEQRDILALLMCARGDDGEWLSDSEIRDDLITLMLAGHETTATTLAWVFDLLLHHPEALRRVRAEAVSGAEDFTTAVINETLRVRPPAPSRHALPRNRFASATIWWMPERALSSTSSPSTATPASMTIPTSSGPSDSSGCARKPTPGCPSVGA
ncbi:hypothetical protein NIIDMKKI_00710 [Mycobacterium kansasii]|uniref:Cytochrome P450 family protein n=1 Tax=Mycobacterium kansasii TaxID=1768 RepID=A0A7G1I4S1_MYCKA|nr:hypothetical protein NIIDMKKI_00710 [Mycobacterium kansasii]